MKEERLKELRNRAQMIADGYTSPRRITNDEILELLTALDSAKAEAFAQCAGIAREVGEGAYSRPEWISERRACDAVEEAVKRASPDPEFTSKIRDAAYRDAAKLVCGYCDGHFTSWESEARRGAPGSGNWIHREKGDASRHQLCAATGIYNKLEFAAALRGQADCGPIPGK